MKIGCTKEQVWDEWLRIYRKKDNTYLPARQVFLDFGKKEAEGITEFLEKCNLNILNKIYSELKKL